MKAAKIPPIRKEVNFLNEEDMNSNKLLFKEYKNARDSFMQRASKIKEVSNWKKLSELLVENKKNLGNDLSFKCLEILAFYKTNEDDLPTLRQALKNIKESFPDRSSDHELLGLWVSVSRKIFEKTAFNDDNYKSSMDETIRSSDRFYRPFKTPYSISQKLLIEAKIVHEKIKKEFDNPPVAEYLSNEFFFFFKFPKEGIGKH